MAWRRGVAEVLFCWSLIGVHAEIFVSGAGGHSLEYHQYNHKGETKHIIGFGDSYTASKFDYKGQLPSESCPLGNPSCVTGNPWATHGGHNWITSLTSVYNRSLTTTYNYAVYGAFLDIEINGGYSGTSIIQHQYPRFLNNIKSGGISDDILRSQHTLFVIWSGINDVAAKYEILSEAERKKFATNYLDTNFNFARNLSTIHGAHNFLFLSSPPMERSPSALRQSEVSRAKRKQLINAINGQFPSCVKDFRMSLERSGQNGDSVNVFFYDAHEAFTRILNAPGEYGFSSATDWGSTSSMFWGDSYHVGAYGHAIFAKEVGELLENGGFWGYSSKTTTSRVSAGTVGHMAKGFLSQVVDTWLHFLFM